MKTLKKLSLIVLMAVIMLSVMSAGFSSDVASAQDVTLITTRNALYKAIGNASEGDTVYVGDIDFTTGGLRNDVARIALEKSLTIKNGKTEGKAVFTGGSFNVKGTKVAGQKLCCTFEDIVFDGGVDGDTLTEEDWALPVNSSNEPTSDEPLKAQYAVSFSGNVDAYFSNCEFTRFMYPEGGAIWCRYGDYSLSSDMLFKYGDNSVCIANIYTDKCNFYKNSALYSGGAVFLEGCNNNVNFYATNCNFTENISAAGFSCEGGGAIYSRKANVTLSGCNLLKNVANFVYSEELPFSDQTKGGAVLSCEKSKLNMINCVVAENKASIGGGLSLSYTTAQINGCIIAKNRAQQNKVYSEYDRGPWGNVGFGGAIYVTNDNAITVSIFNTSIYLNSASNAYGGLYAFFNLDYGNSVQEYGEVDLVLCTYADNSCDTAYDYTESEFPWYDAPGDIWEIPYVTAYGCVIVDESLKEDFPRYELPSEDNGYNYYASPEKAATDNAITVDKTATSYNQILLNDGFQSDVVISSETLQTLVGDTFGVGVGSFGVGSNYASTYKIRLNFNDGKTASYDVSFAYGDEVALPTPVRRGYIFSAWNLSDGTALDYDTLLVSDRTDYLELTAVWVNKPVPVAAVALSSCAVFLAIAVVLFVVLYKRRHTVAVPETADVETDFSELPIAGKSEPDTSMLSVREKEILTLLLEGKQRSEIGKALFVSESTVKKYISSIYKKLDVSSRSELFAKFR